MAAALLSGLNNARYGVPLNELHSDFRTGCDEYRKTLTSAYDMVINRKGDTEGVSATPNDSVGLSQPRQTRRTYTSRAGGRR